MTNAVTWMWIGNHQQINTTPGTPETGTEADGMKGYKVVGQNQIKPVELDGQLRAINTAPVSYTHLTLPTTPYV